MSNWAKLDKDNNIVNVEITDANWVEQFYLENPKSNFKYIKETSTTKVAIVDGFYDEENKKFIAPQPFSNWILDENFDWIPPIPKPVGNYEWNQDNNDWVEFFPPTKPYPTNGRVYRWDQESSDWILLD